MSKDFLVSVVIPVYNAEAFLQSSVLSVVNNPCAHEILLIEDGSTDDSRRICDELAEVYDKVRVLCHPGNFNRGAGATRNLGLQQARCAFISFLDADDYYLPNRFDYPRLIFSQDDSVDGVYEAVGTEVLGVEAAVHREGKLTTVAPGVSPEELFSVLIRPGYRGHFQTNGIVFRKALLEKTGYFDPELKLHQDTHLWIRMAYFGKLVPGNLNEAVAVRRVHPNNRITHRNYLSHQLLRVKLFEALRNLPMKKADYRFLARLYLSYHPDRCQPKSAVAKTVDWMWLATKEVVKGNVKFSKIL